MKKLLTVICYLLLVASAYAAVRGHDQFRPGAGGVPPMNRVDAQMETLHQIYLLHGGTPGATVNIDEIPLPIPVRREPEFIAAIRAGTVHPTIATLRQCQQVLMGMAEMVWDTPNMGIGGTGPMGEGCQAVVQLRMAGPSGMMGPNDVVLAVARVPAGGSMLCNAFHFPENGLTPAIADVEVPPDAEPTREQVIETMNRENQQNVGIRTGVAALAGGAAMFFLAPDSMNRGAAVAAGAAVGGGVGFGAAQMGHVGGAVLQSAVVNAATGAVIGNVGAGMFGGNARLQIERCVSNNYYNLSGYCLWGHAVTGARNYRTNPAVINVQNGITGGSAEQRPDRDDEPIQDCFLRQDGSVICRHEGDRWRRRTGFRNIMVPPAVAGAVPVTAEERRSNWSSVLPTDVVSFYDYGGYFRLGGEESFVRIVSMLHGGTPQMAMIPNVNNRGVRGWTLADWNNTETRGNIVSSQLPVPRANDGSQSRHGVVGTDIVNEIRESLANDTFVPLTITAQDGEIIDFGNQARLGGTVAGAGAGAALGGISARAGAMEEVEMRFFQALDEYRAMIRRFYCISGTRQLGNYNMTIMIPNM